MAEKKKEEDVSKVFTPFGVMVGDAGSKKAFDAQSFYEEVLKPSEKAQYEKFKVDFLKNPKDKTKKTSSGFIPWNKLVTQSKSRNIMMLNKIMSNTWALNKEAIPGFIDLIEKLRGKYSTVLGDDKLLEYLEAAQHRARELEASGEVDGGSSSSESVKSSKSAEQFDQWDKAREYLEQNNVKGLNQYLFRQGYSDQARSEIVKKASSQSEGTPTNSSLNIMKSACDLDYFYSSRDLVDNKLVSSSESDPRYVQKPYSFPFEPYGDPLAGSPKYDKQFQYAQGLKRKPLSQSVTYNEHGIPLNSDRWDTEPCLTIEGCPVWIEKDYYTDHRGQRHEGYLVNYQLPNSDCVEKLAFDIDMDLEELEDKVREAIQNDLDDEEWGGRDELFSSHRIKSNAEGVDQQAYNNYIQQLVETGVPEDQARQMADQMVNQIQQNTAQFVQNIQQPAQGNSPLAASFKRSVKSSLEKDLAVKWAAQQKAEDFFRTPKGILRDVLFNGSAEDRNAFKVNLKHYATWGDDSSKSDYWYDMIMKLARKETEYNVSSALKQPIKSGFYGDEDEEEDNYCDICGSPDGVCICNDEKSQEEQIREFIDDTFNSLKGQVDAIKQGIMTEEELLEWIRDQLSVGYSIDKSLAPYICKTVMDKFGDTGTLASSKKSINSSSEWTAQRIAEEYFRTPSGFLGCLKWDGSEEDRVLFATKLSDSHYANWGNNKDIAYRWYDTVLKSAKEA